MMEWLGAVSSIGTRAAMRLELGFPPEDMGTRVTASGVPRFSACVSWSLPGVDCGCGCWWR